MSQTGTLWAVIGATATGKTALSLDLAEHLQSTSTRGVEIVNADAMQLYRGMDIGTAKLATTERRGIPHHMFDVCEVTDEATVAWYQGEARAKIADIFSRGNDAILVGGSGLYVSSVLFDFQFAPRDESLRAELEQVFETNGISPLLERLRKLDDEVADTIDVSNPRRVIRALEVASLGAKAPASLPAKPQLWHEHTNIIGVHCDREVLVQRLDARVIDMWAHGLLNEVRSLATVGLAHGKTASRAIGYAQALAELNGEISQSEAIERTQALTRKYARRQVSWFQRYPNVHWIDGTTSVTLSGIPSID